MPTASQRPALDRKSGASTASNETPVSTAERPNPPPGDNTRATRTPELARNQKTVGTPAGPANKANGRDHPTESEHDHEHQKLKGASAERQSPPRPKR